MLLSEMQKWFQGRSCDDSYDSKTTMSPTISDELDSGNETSSICSALSAGTTLRETQTALRETLQVVSLKEKIIVDLKEEIKKKDETIQTLNTKVDKLQAVIRVHVRTSNAGRPQSLGGLFSNNPTCLLVPPKHENNNDQSPDRNTFSSESRGSGSKASSREEVLEGAVADLRVKRNAISAEPSSHHQSHTPSAPKAFPKPDR